MEQDTIDLRKDFSRVSRVRFRFLLVLWNVVALSEAVRNRGQGRSTQRYPARWTGDGLVEAERGERKYSPYSTLRFITVSSLNARTTIELEGQNVSGQGPLCCLIAYSGYVTDQLFLLLSPFLPPPRSMDQNSRFPIDSRLVIFHPTMIRSSTSYKQLDLLLRTHSFPLSNTTLFSPSNQCPR